MTLHLIATNPNPGPATDALAPAADHLHAILHVLIDLGSGLARQIHQQAKNSTAPGASAPKSLLDLVTAFTSVGRAIRTCIALDHKLIGTPDPAELRFTRRQVIRAIEDAMQRNAHISDAEFIDRDNGPDLDDEIGDRPALDIIAEACRDLAFAATPDTHPWPRGTPADIVALCTRAA